MINYELIKHYWLINYDALDTNIYKVINYIDINDENMFAV